MLVRGVAFVKILGIDLDFPCCIILLHSGIWGHERHPLALRRQKAACLCTKKQKESIAVWMCVGDIRRKFVHEGEMAGILNHEDFDVSLFCKHVFEKVCLEGRRDCVLAACPDLDRNLDACQCVGAAKEIRRRRKKHQTIE